MDILSLINYRFVHVWNFVALATLDLFKYDEVLIVLSFLCMHVCLGFYDPWSNLFYSLADPT